MMSQPLVRVARCWRIAVVGISVAMATVVAAQLLVASFTPDRGRPGNDEVLSPSVGTAAMAAAPGKLPVRFEANRGQAAPDVHFVARAGGNTLLLTRSEAVILLRQRESGPATGPIRMRLVGAAPSPGIEPQEPLAGVTNYMLGDDPAGWVTGVPSYGRVRYGEAYPGIDVVYYGNQEGQLEYDFVVSPGADPSKILIAFDGHERLAVDGEGNLAVTTGDVVLRQSRPLSYQIAAGRRQGVPSRYVVDGEDRVRLEVGPYDRGRELVIDPVLTASTYLGGSRIDEPYAVATDSEGNAYVTGSTTSVDFPLTATGGYDRKCGEDGQCDAPATASMESVKSDIFVAKLTADGSALAYATYIGGSGAERGVSIAVDKSGKAFVAGHTDSANFPTPNGFDQKCGSDATANCDARSLDADPRITVTNPDGFLVKLDATGSELVYGSYIGGSGNDSERAGGITYRARNGTVDEPGDQAPDNEQTTHPMKHNFGHPGPAAGVAVDAAGHAYVVGSTMSPDFAEYTTPDAYDRSCGSDGMCNKTVAHPCGTFGGHCPYVRLHPDAFLVKIDTTASARQSLAYATYVGGSGADVAKAVALDAHPSAPANHVYLTGYSSSPVNAAPGDAPWPPGDPPALVRPICQATAPKEPFPTTANAYQPLRPQHAGGDSPCSALPASGFVVRFDVGAPAEPLHYSSFLAGHEGDDTPTSVAAWNGDAYIAGLAGSSSFPTGSRDPDVTVVQPTPGGSGDAFVARVDTNSAGAESRVFATYLGGSDRETAHAAVAVDADGRAHVVGSTSSHDYPTATPLPGVHPPDPCIASNVASCSDTFVSVLEPDGSAFRYSTYLRGTTYDNTGDGGDVGRGIAVWTDASSQVPYAYVVGQTGTNDFPIVNPYQDANGGYLDGFVARISPVVPPTPHVAGLEPSRASSGGGTEIVITGTGLAGTTHVTFGQTAVPPVDVSPDGAQLKVVAPPGLGPVNVTVTTPLGTSLPASRARLRYFEGAWSTEEPGPAFARSGNTMTVLEPEMCRNGTAPEQYPCGQVLITGGTGDPGTDDPNAKKNEFYNPADGSRRSTSDSWFSHPAGHTATLLHDGTVLLVTGTNAEVYDPSNDTWQKVGQPRQARSDHTATLIGLSNCGANCRKVLFVGGGGATASSRTAELYDPVSKSFDLTAPPLDARPFLHTATILGPSNCGTNCGKVLVVGGAAPGYNPEGVASAEMYDASEGRWTDRITGITPRYSHTATFTTSGKVLIAGGILGVGGKAPGVPTAGAELYDPTKPLDQAFSPTGPLESARSGHVAAALPDGRVVVAGGGGGFVDTSSGKRRPPLKSVEVYDPRAGAWRPGDDMNEERGAGRMPAGHAAVVVAGKVLVSGGRSYWDPDGTAYGSSAGVTTPALTAEVYTPGPYITGITPPAVGPAGGDTVDIAGSWFGNAGTTSTSVTFAGVPASELSVQSPTLITARPPPAGEEPLVEARVIVPHLGLATHPFAYSEGLGAVNDLVARALSGKEVLLNFSAVGFPPAEEYVVKQSQAPITDAGFDAALDVCEGGVCRLKTRTYRDELAVSVGGLTPETTYYYAVRVKGPDGALGPLSNVASATTGDVAPGEVRDLAAAALNDREVRLTFSAPGSNDFDPPPATKYLVKQSTTPIVDAQSFEEASALCEGLCTLEPSEVGEALSLTVTGLARDTTYHYALRALDDAGNLGPLSNSASAGPACIAPEAGPGRVVYQPGYQLVGLPGGTRLPAQSVLYSWFNLGRGGRYSVQAAHDPVAAGQGYWAWFSCPRIVEIGAGTSSASSPLTAYRASMVGNPSGTSQAVVSGHDFTARWDAGADAGRGGYQVSAYREEQGLSVGEGIWAFSYRDTTIAVTAW